MIAPGYKAAMGIGMRSFYHGQHKVYCHKCGKEVYAMTEFPLENQWGAFDFNYGYQLECGHIESTVPQGETK